MTKTFNRTIKSVKSTYHLKAYLEKMFLEPKIKQIGAEMTKVWWLNGDVLLFLFMSHVLESCHSIGSCSTLLVHRLICDDLLGFLP